jgi:glycosyltransferase involved in cell wall biosynthesis
MVPISVILCTHNPRLSYLRRVLESLQAQTLPSTEWQLLIVDNASDQPLSQEANVGWHPSARCVREEKVGLAHARLRGISETISGLLVFVDDDTVLKPDYFAKALEIAGRYPMLGAWSGQLIPEYEITPPAGLHHFLELLCIRTLERDIWGNNPIWQHIPWGPGMCVRRQVAERYLQDVSNNPLRLSLGHAGNRVSCHEDTDLAITSLDVSLGIGLFRDLMLTHLIPERRLKESYLLQVAENSAAAFIVLKSIRGLKIEDPPRGRRKWIKWLQYWAASDPQRKVEKARTRGETMGRALIADSKGREPTNSEVNKETRSSAKTIVQLKSQSITQ